MATRGKDRIPPVVSITAPANNAAVTGVTAITATATDNVGVTKVEFYVNDVLIATDTTSSYATTYNFTADGTYTIKATAYDAKGNNASHSIIVKKTTVIIVVPPDDPLPASITLAEPPIWHQGSEGACAAMTSARMFTITRYNKNGDVAYDNAVNVFSPEFTYDYKKKQEFDQSASWSCGQGSSLLGNLANTYTFGICLWATLPYSGSPQGCQTTSTAPIQGNWPCDPCVLSNDVLTEALDYKISSYGTILSTDETMIKQKLVEGYALGFGFQMDMNYYTSTCDYIWNSRGELMFTHAMTIVGYDDAKHAYLASNSWGTAWGCNGRIWIDYDFLTTLTGYVYWLEPDLS
jgi:hypothetical protein